MIRLDCVRVGWSFGWLGDMVGLDIWLDWIFLGSMRFGLVKSKIWIGWGLILLSCLFSYVGDLVGWEIWLCSLCG